MFQYPKQEWGGAERGDWPPTVKMLLAAMRKQMDSNPHPLHKVQTLLEDGQETPAM